MESVYIRNASGNPIARIEIRESGDQHLWNIHGNYLGHYNSDVNTTTNEHGNYIGRGNLLMTLVK